jgi:hypothetical protein
MSLMAADNGSELGSWVNGALSKLMSTSSQLPAVTEAAQELFGQLDLPTISDTPVGNLVLGNGGFWTPSGGGTSTLPVDNGAELPLWHGTGSGGGSGFDLPDIIPWTFGGSLFSFNNNGGSGFSLFSAPKSLSAATLFSDDNSVDTLLAKGDSADAAPSGDGLLSLGQMDVLENSAAPETVAALDQPVFADPVLLTPEALDANGDMSTFLVKAVTE